MTERGRDDVVREPARLAIGSSSVRWDGDALVAELEERATPLPRRVVGTIRVTPEAVNTQTFALDPAGLHSWRPAAPQAHVEVTLQSPALTWRGHAYVDMNWGAEPLEAGFQSWDWSRGRLARGSAVFYEGIGRSGDPFALALRFDPTGRPEPITAPPQQRLRRTNWLLPRQTRGDHPGAARLIRTLEDTPFYTRSLLTARIFGEDAPTIHESVDLDRFASRWVQTLLPYRMPRRPSGA